MVSTNWRYVFNKECALSNTYESIIVTYLSISGLVADSLNSYTHAFQMAGAVVFVGACIPFVLLCTKDRDPKKKAAVQIIEL